MDVVRLSASHNMSTFACFFFFFSLSAERGCTHISSSSSGTPNKQTRGGGSQREVSRDDEKEEKVGDYFRIKGPVDLFLFSAFSLKLQLSHLASLFLFLTHLYPPQSFPNFALSHCHLTLPGTRSLSVLFSARPHFLKSLLFSYSSGSAPP